MTKSAPTGKAMIIIILLLYICTTLHCGAVVISAHSSFVNNAQSIVTEYLSSYNPRQSVPMVEDLALLDCVGTALSSYSASNSSSHLCNSLGAVFKIIATYKIYITGSSDDTVYDFIIYSSSILATTLWCTVLIIYRIVTVAQAGRGALRAYHHVIEVFIESSALYSITLIIYIGLYSCDNWTETYITVVAASARGIAPTLLVGRVAAGHARPDDSWQGSQDSKLGSMTSDDLEAQAAQSERDEEYGHHARADSEGDTGLQSVVHKDGTKVQLEISNDGHYYNKNDLRGDDLEAHPNRLRDDDLHAILVVPKD
ncbi:hypothetical protein ARMGADRAFT_1030107 [Armillaria gallica]|uniref:Uncharacterized protein n=1 Tax=Armillaria gallica TaxID=47427 RepID=A0A2H3DE21_ARMGA|nr:hypothetical protein ARMGADRAFT_1030107 [Armillaria gallica]